MYCRGPITSDCLAMIALPLMEDLHGVVVAGPVVDPGRFESGQLRRVFTKRIQIVCAPGLRVLRDPLADNPLDLTGGVQSPLVCALLLTDHAPGEAEDEGRCCQLVDQ